LGHPDQVRVVVFGATGNIGSAVLEELVQLSEVNEIVAVARRMPDVAPPHEKVTWATADIGEDDLAPLVAHADVVVHLAWLFQPTRRPETTWQSNVVGSARLLDAVARASVRHLVVSSSVAAYSPGPGAWADESWPTHGASPAAYAREKAYVERMLDTFSAQHPDRRVARVRPAFTFSRRSAVQQRRLFAGPFVPQRLVRPDLLPALPWPSGLTVQTVHASDLARSFRAIVERSATGAFNVAADDVIDADRVAAMFGVKVLPMPPRAARAALASAWHGHVAPAPPRLFDALMSLPLMSTRRAREQLDWRPLVTAEGAIDALLVGLHEGTGGDTPPLAPETSGPGRVNELASGVGQRP
jgi:nucleoside-diphosphate-sugar epimerase